MDLSEKCGVVGIFSNDSPDVARAVYYALWTLQHRGQESSGIASTNGRRIMFHKGKGLVANVYHEEDLTKLTGNIAIGHNRYATFGKWEVDHSQPVCFHNNTLALAHNGNLPDIKKLKTFLNDAGISTSSMNDSEMMYAAIEQYIVKGKSLEDAVRWAYPLFQGAFSVVVMNKKQLIAFRDHAGIRPLCIGKYNHSYIVASETCALDAIGAEFVRDVAPGEMIVIDKEGLRSQQLKEGTNHLDVFEYIYFARPDSQLQGKNVYEVRKELGRQLARELKIDADIVIPVPDSAIPAAIGYSQESNIPFEQALVKNRYIHRTFISPSQKQRLLGVKMKLNPIRSAIEGKRIIIIDDSIVRGTTSKTLVSILKECGAKEIHMLISSPPVLYPDFYGIDTPIQNDLIAATKTHAEMVEYLHVDTLQYLSYEGMIKSIGIPEEELCTACFTGNYPLSIGINAKKVKKVIYA